MNNLVDEMMPALAGLGNTRLISAGFASTKVVARCGRWAAYSIPICAGLSGCDMVQTTALSRRPDTG
jgi:hypothetical protein